MEKELQGIEEKYVTHKHFESVLEPIQDMCKEIQRDIKKLLSMVGKGSGP